MSDRQIGQLDDDLNGIEQRLTGIEQRLTWVEHTLSDHGKRLTRIQGDLSRREGRSECSQSDAERDPPTSPRSMTWRSRAGYIAVAVMIGVVWYRLTAWLLSPWPWGHLANVLGGGVIGFVLSFKWRLWE